MKATKQVKYALTTEVLLAGDQRKQTKLNLTKTELKKEVLRNIEIFGIIGVKFTITETFITHK